MSDETTTTSEEIPEVSTAPAETAPVVNHDEVLEKIAVEASTYLSKPVTVEDIGNVVAWASGEKSETLENTLKDLDNTDFATQVKAAVRLLNSHAIQAAAVTPAVSIRQSFQKKAMERAAQVPIQTQGKQQLDYAQVTATIVATAKQTGEMPAPMDILKQFNLV